MRLGIVGSRNFTDEKLMVDVLLDFKFYDNESGKMISFFRLDAVVSGGAKGADSIAARLATSSGIEVIEHLPSKEHDWPAAAFIRNQLIVDDSDMLMAFFGPGEPVSVNKSGTMDTVRKAMKKRIPVYLYFQHEGDHRGEQEPAAGQ